MPSFHIRTAVGVYIYVYIENISTKKCYLLCHFIFYKTGSWWNSVGTYIHSNAVFFLKLYEEKQWTHSELKMRSSWIPQSKFLSFDPYSMHGSWSPKRIVLYAENASVKATTSQNFEFILWSGDIVVVAISTWMNLNLTCHFLWNLKHWVAESGKLEKWRTINW